jgi:hypothetical protein
MTTIKEFTNQAEAALLQSFLRNGEIDAVLVDEHAAAWCRAPLLVPIRVQVPDEQVDDALSLLQSLEDSSPTAADQ